MFWFCVYLLLESFCQCYCLACIIISFYSIVSFVLICYYNVLYLLLIGCWLGNFPAVFDSSTVVKRRGRVPGSSPQVSQIGHDRSPQSPIRSHIELNNMQALKLCIHCLSTDCIKPVLFCWFQTYSTYTPTRRDRGCWAWPSMAPRRPISR